MKGMAKILLGNLTLGVLSALALILQYLALADIAKESDSSFEWRIVGACMLVIGSFVILTIVTLGYLIRRTEHAGHVVRHEKAT